MRQNQKETVIQLYSFEAFGGDVINSAQEACFLLAEKDLEGITVNYKTLPCEFVAEDFFAHEFHGSRPDYVIAIGQAGGRPDITLERVAINLDDSVQGEDNRGNKPREKPIIRNAPFAYYSPIATQDCVNYIKQAGIPCSISDTAGTFVCNHVFYLLSHLFSTEYRHIPVSFVHIPFTPSQACLREKTPSMSTEIAVQGLSTLLEYVHRNRDAIIAKLAESTVHYS